MHFWLPGGSREHCRVGKYHSTTHFWSQEGLTGKLSSGHILFDNALLVPRGSRDHCRVGNTTRQSTFGFRKGSMEHCRVGKYHHSTIHFFDSTGGSKEHCLVGITDNRLSHYRIKQHDSSYPDGHPVAVSALFGFFHLIFGPCGGLHLASPWCHVRQNGVNRHHRCLAFETLGYILRL